MSPKRWPLGSQDQKNAPQLFLFCMTIKAIAGGPFSSSEYELTGEGWGGTLDLLFVFPFHYYYSASSHSLQNRISSLSRHYKGNPRLFDGICIELLLLLSISLTHFSKTERDPRKSSNIISFLFAPNPLPACFFLLKTLWIPWSPCGFEPEISDLIPPVCKCPRSECVCWNVQKDFFITFLNIPLIASSVADVLCLMVHIQEAFPNP